MIDYNAIDIHWIEKVSKANRKADMTLVEKTIRAFVLLEGLAGGNRIEVSADGGADDHGEDAQCQRPVGRQTDCLCAKHDGHSLLQTRQQHEYGNQQAAL